MASKNSHEKSGVRPNPLMIFPLVGLLTITGLTGYYGAKLKHVLFTKNTTKPEAGNVDTKSHTVFVGDTSHYIGDVFAGVFPIGDVVAVKTPATDSLAQGTENIISLEDLKKAKKYLQNDDEIVYDIPGFGETSFVFYNGEILVSWSGYYFAINVGSGVVIQSGHPFGVNNNDMEHNKNVVMSKFLERYEKEHGEGGKNK